MVYIVKSTHKYCAFCSAGRRCGSMCILHNMQQNITLTSRPPSAGSNHQQRRCNNSQTDQRRASGGQDTRRVGTAAGQGSRRWNDVGRHCRIRAAQASKRPRQKQDSPNDRHQRLQTRLQRGSTVHGGATESQGRCPGQRFASQHCKDEYG